MKKVFSIIFSFISIIVMTLFIISISLKVYNINELNNIINLINNDFNIKIINNLNFIFKTQFMISTLIIFIIIFIILSLINIKNKFFNSLKYIGSSMIISGSFTLIGGLFFDKIISSLNTNVKIILNNNRIEFLNSINHKSIIFIIIGLLLIILFSIIDTIIEKYKNQKLIEDNIELIEE